MRSYIVLIRHGITEGIKRHWFYGWTDLPIIEEGYEQLRQYKEEGAYPELPDDTKYYTTGFVRTTQTLRALFGDVPYKEIPDLKEINFGDPIKINQLIKKYKLKKNGDFGCKQ